MSVVDFLVGEGSLQFVSCRNVQFSSRGEEYCESNAKMIADRT